MAYTKGIKLSSDVTAATTSAGVGTAPDLRRLYDFSDRVAELTPEESPFFVYLSKVAKDSTDDSVFRFLENRSKIDWTTRNFLIKGNQNGSAAVTAGTAYDLTVDTEGGASVDWLVKGMVFSVNSIDSAAGWSQVLVRVNSGVTDNGSDSSFSGMVVDLSNSGITNYNKILDNVKCQVIGTAFAEGSGSPDAWSNDIEDDYGYTQIFKTACEMSNTSIATRYRGYANEWDRIWALKLREHKVDIERAMLFGQKARISGIQYSEGIIGHIVKNGSVVADDTAFSYTSGAPFVQLQVQSLHTTDS